MFTGIIQGLGKVTDYSSGTLHLITDLNLEDCKIGSSISCDGICLTATNIFKEDNKFYLTVNVGEETIIRSNIASQQNSKIKIINLEKSLKVGDEISGHFVYGHVDLTTKILDIQKLKNSWIFIFEKKITDKNNYIVEKASITINGISLTIANLENNSFSVSIIPHTFFNTNLQYANINDLVNVEFDYLARFIINK